MEKVSTDKNTWIPQKGDELSFPPTHAIEPVVLPDEESVGFAMFNELRNTAKSKTGDINIAHPGGRGAQVCTNIWENWQRVYP